MKFLGIDYGTKRIGFAVSDDGGRLAFPLEVIKNNGEIMDKLEALIVKEKIKEIVVGESLDFAGLPNILQKEVYFFITKLKNNRKFKIPVHQEKEFLTSIEARRYGDFENVRSSEAYSRRKNKKSTSVDASAAALILQRYLDKFNKSLLA